MNTETATAFRRLLRAALLSVLALLSAPSAARADANTANDSAQFIVRLSPNVDMGVIVDTAGAAWAGSSDLDAVLAMNSESILATGVKLTVTGNFNVQELTLEGAALDTWTLDTDETPGADAMRLYALIGDDQSAAPSSALFNGASNLVTATPTRAGQVQADEGGNTNHVYEFSSSQAPQYADADNMAVGTVRRLWLRANTPPQTSSDEQQRFTLTVTAVSGAGL